MADAQVLTPDQVAQLLAAQQQQQASTSSTSSASTPSNRLKTSFEKRRAFEPFYTGGATALTPDGTLLFAALNEDVSVVHVATGNIVQRIDGDTEEITALAVSPDGAHLIVTSRSLSLRIFSLPECTLVRTVPKAHASQVNLMCVDPTSTLLATGGSDGVAKVWDIAGGFCTHAFKGHAGVVSALAWNLPPAETAPKSAKKGKKPQRVMHLLTGSVDGKVRVWDLNNQAELHKPVATLAGHDSVVRGIAVAERGDVVVTGSRDRTLVVWRLGSNAPSAAAWKQAETLSANEGIESVGFLPTRNTFWTGGSDGQLRLWDVSSSTIIAREPRSFNERLAAHQSDDEETRAITAVHLVSPAQGEAWLVSVHADQNIVVRSASPTQPLKKVRQLIGFNDEIVDVALLASHGAAETHLAVATNSRALRVYELGSDETSAELLAGHTDIVLCVDRSPDMRLLASGAKDRTARIWAWVPTNRLSPTDTTDADGDTGKRIRRPTAALSDEVDSSEGEGEGEWVCVAVCEGHAESVGAIAFARRATKPGAPYAPFIVTASQDRTIKLWDLSPLTALLESTAAISAPLSLKSLLTQRVHDKDINTVDVSPNNAMIATGSQDRTAKLFSLSFSSSPSGSSARVTPLAVLKGHKRGVWACRFSPVDLALATASGDKTIRLWSLSTFASVKVFEGHTNSVLKLGFVAAGMQLVSCAGDGLVKVWNVKDEECALTVDAHDDKIWSFAVSRDEGWFVSAAADGTMHVWEDNTQQRLEVEREQKEDEVRMEQQFANLLTTRDWRNAIVLALQMDQPRRLLNLFTQVANSRPDTTGGLIDDALGGSTGGDAGSITGLASVDGVLATLSGSQLIQLLNYVRDWNTSTRTSAIAQTLLHAILSTHTAASLLALFDREAKTQRAAIAQRAEDEELGIAQPRTDKVKAQQRRQHQQLTLDLASLVDALTAYSQRHFQRADRTRIEAAMLEYSITAMDSLLGPQDDDDDQPKDAFEDQIHLESEQEQHEDSDVDMSE